MQLHAGTARIIPIQSCSIKRKFLVDVSGRAPPTPRPPPQPLPSNVLQTAFPPRIHALPSRSHGYVATDGRICPPASFNCRRQRRAGVHAEA